MDATRTSLLSLLALAYAESLPALSFADICALLPPSRAENKTPVEVASLLARLEKDGVIFSSDGWYALTGAPDTDEIKKRADISRRAIARNRFFFFLMQTVPFVEASAITGSVSMGSAHEKSDVDILCVVTRGRLWTSRILLLFLAELFGKRREQRYGLDKLCFNCFITKNTPFPLRTIASAHMLARAIPLFGDSALTLFFAHNTWTKEYVSRPARASSISLSRPFRGVSIASAWLLSGSIGDALERSLARWQIRRLRRKVTKGSDASGLIFRDDLITLYYPDIKNKTVMKRYADTINTLHYEKN